MSTNSLSTQSLTDSGTDSGTDSVQKLISALAVWQEAQSMSAFSMYHVPEEPILRRCQRDLIDTEWQLLAKLCELDSPSDEHRLLRLMLALAIAEHTNEGDALLTAIYSRSSELDEAISAFVQLALSSTDQAMVALACRLKLNSCLIQIHGATTAALSSFADLLGEPYGNFSPPVCGWGNLNAWQLKGSSLTSRLAAEQILTILKKHFGALPIGGFGPKSARGILDSLTIDVEGSEMKISFSHDQSQSNGKGGYKNECYLQAGYELYDFKKLCTALSRSGCFNFKFESSKWFDQKIENLVFGYIDCFILRAMQERGFGIAVESNVSARLALRATEFRHIPAGLEIKDFLDRCMNQSIDDFISGVYDFDS